MIVPRYIRRLVGGTGAPTGHEIWGDTRVRLSFGTHLGTSDRRWRCQISGRIVTARGGIVELGRVLDPFPVTLLAPVESPS